MTRTYYGSQVPVMGSYKCRKIWKVKHSRNIPTMLASDAVRDHINWLRDIGFNDNSIAVAAGITNGTVWKCRTGQHDRISAECGERILKVTHIPVAAQATHLVPAIGVQRRLHALQRIGHSNAVIAQHLGCPASHVGNLAKRTAVRGSTWQRVADVYEALSATPGASQVSVDLAIKAGRPSPMSWEGIDIDHPDSEPILDAETDGEAIDEVALQRMIDGRHIGEVRGAERKALIDHAIAKGWDHDRLARSLNISPDGAGQALVRRRRELRKEVAA